MARKIQVQLAFSADTKAAQQQMASLQQQLSNLAATPVSVGGQKMSQELREATQDAISLKIALNNATNVNTGKLNFGKFNQELKASKMSLEQYAASLQRLGPQGTQTFVQLAKAIRQSETPIIQLKGKVAALGQTLANTVRWQISSTLIQGFTSAISGTIGYAKELNETLNNIRIVTGKSTDDMSKFAKQANNAAKALSTTTTEYTKASLIYFQQGLSDKEVKQRTETTLKLANVTSTEAATVSEWMTAIWNNFDDGSKTLESYADSLAKLGAATASSADEIAGGLEKFAAVADTVNLSFDYAAAALATITAETRQSEDVVGTALKTIFARVENLKLGETLEDGTDLGQYSAALEKVGVNIKDSNGQLKDMDNIIDSIGKQWGLLNKDQQVALAQSVAGIRQYNQFIALMNNYDTMKENVELSKESLGTLELQNQIYKEGIEGSTQRVTANLEAIKNTLLDENDLVPLLNFAEGFLKVTNDLIEAFGGLPGLLTTLTALMLKLFGPQVATSIKTIVSDLSLFKGTLTGSIQAERSQAIQKSAKLGADMAAQGAKSGEVGLAQSSILKEEAKITAYIEENEKNISAENRAQIELQRQLLEQKSEILLAEAKNLDNAIKEKDKVAKELQVAGVEDSQLDEIENAALFNDKVDTFDNKQHNRTKDGLMGEATELRNQALNAPIDDAAAEQIRNTYSELADSVEEYQNAFSEVKEIEKNSNKEDLKSNKIYQDKKKKLEELGKTVDKNKSRFSAATKNSNVYEKTLDKVTKEVKNNKNVIGDQTEALKKHGDLTRTINKTTKDRNAAQKEYNETVDETADKIDKAILQGQNWSTTLVSGVQGVASAAAGIQMMIGAFDSLSTAMAEGKVGLSDYFATFTSITMALPMFISGLSEIGKVYKKIKLSVEAYNLEKKKEHSLNLIGMVLDKMAAKVKVKADQEEINSSKKKRLEKMSEILTNLAEWASRGPWGWVVLAASLALIGGLVAGISAIAAAPKKEAQRNEETMQQDQEKVDKKNEEVEENTESIKSYNELLEKYKTTGEGKDELAAAAQKLAEAYGIEGAALAKLSGNYDDFNKKLNEARIKELQEQQSLATNALGSQEYKLEEAVLSKRGTMYTRDGKSSYEVEFNDDGKNTSQDQTMVNLLETVAAEMGTSDIVQTVDAGDGDVRLRIATPTPENYVKLYDTIQEAQRLAAEQGVTSGNSNVYKEVSEWLANSQEQVDVAKGNLSIRSKAAAEEKVRSTTSKSGKSIGEIESFQDYQTYRAEVLSGVEEGSDEYKNIMSAIGSFDNVSEYETMSKAIDEQGAKLAGDSKEKLSKAYASASEAMVRAMASVEVTEGMTWEEFQAEAKANMVGAAESMRKETAGRLKLSDTQDTAYYRVIKTNNKHLKDNAYLLNLVAEEGMDFNDKLKTFTETWEDNSEALFDANQSTTSYAYALGSVAEGLGTLLGTDADLTDFVHENKDFVAEFMQGNIDLLDDIQLAAGKATAETYSSVQGLDTLFTAIGNKDYKVGEQVDLTKFQSQLDSMIQNNPLAEEAIKRVAESMGFLAEISDEGTVSITRLTDDDLIADWAEKQKKKLDELIDSLDRFFEVNEKLDDVGRYQDNLQRKIDDSYGADKQVLMENYQKRLKEEINLLNRKLGIAKEVYAEERKNILETNYGNSVAIQLDETGQIINRYEVEKSLLGNEEQLKKFQEDADKYTDSLNLVEDLLDEIDTKTAEEAAYDLEQIRAAVEDKIDLKDTMLAQIDFQLQQISDDAEDAAKKLLLLGKQATAQKSGYDANYEGAKGVLANIFGGEDDPRIARVLAGDASAFDGVDVSKTQMDELQGYLDGMREDTAAMIETREEIQSTLTSTFEEFNEDFSDNLDKLDNFSGIVDNFTNMVDILGQTTVGISDEELADIEQVQMDIANAKVNGAKQQMEYNQSALNTANTELANAKERGDENAIKYWEEQVETIDKSLQESTSNFYNSWEEAVQMAADIYEKQMERAFDDLDDKLAGGYSSLEELSSTFDKQQEQASRYLDNGEKLYELSKLNRKLQQDIDKTNNTKAQKELLELQKTIAGYQQDGVNMSQYELEALQKRYDLKLAEIALEEAQNNKSTVRLRRDSEGNFGYVYTADQTNVAETEQKVEDELEANRKLAEDQSVELTQKIIANRQAMVEELRNIRREDFEDTAAYEAKLAETTEYYRGLEAFYVDEANKVVGRSHITYADDYAQYEGWSGKKVDAAEMLKETLGDEETGVYGQMGQNAKGWVENFGGIMEDMVGEYKGPEISAQALSDALGDGQGKGGTGLYNTMLAGAAAWVTGMGTSAQGAAGSFNLLIGKDNDKTGIKGVIASLGNGETTGYYKDASDNVTTWANGSFQKSIEGVNGKLSTIESTADDLAKTISEDGENGKLATITGNIDSWADGELTNKISGAAEKFGLVETKGTDPLAEALYGKNGDPSKPSSNSFFGKTGEALDTFEGNVTDAMKNAGLSITGTGGMKEVMTGFKSHMSKTLVTDKDSVKKRTEAIDTAFDTLKTNATTKFSNIASSVTSFQKTFNPIINSATTAISNLSTAITNLKSKKIYVQTVYQEIRNGNNNFTDYTATGDTGGGDGPLASQYEQGKFVGYANDSRYVRIEDSSGNIKYYNRADIKSYNGNLLNTAQGGIDTNYNTQVTIMGKGYTENELYPRVSFRNKQGGSEIVNGIADDLEDWQGHWWHRNPNDGLWYDSSATGFKRSGDTVSWPHGTKGKNLWELAKYWNKSVQPENGEYAYGYPHPTKTSYLDRGTIYKKGATNSKYANILTDGKVQEVSYHNGTFWYKLQYYQGTQGKYDYAWFNGNSLKSFDTGGYTGSWGSEGRLAMLHQKEIILNAHDTENFLTAVEIVRSMSDRLEANARLAQQGLMGITAAANIAPRGDTLEQNVHITAEFPNATDRHEIEEAFGNLVNLASQYVNRK